MIVLLLLVLLWRMLLLFVLEVLIVILYTLRRGCCLRGTFSSHVTGWMVGLRFLESLVLAVRPVAILDDDRRLGHLPVVGVLFVPTVVVLNHDGRRPFLVLLLHAALAALVRAVCLLDALGRFVQFTLFAI